MPHMTPTDAELLFGLIAGDDPAASPGARAVVELDPYGGSEGFGTAAAQGEPCPFPATDASGGRLVRWGAGTFGSWAEYTVPRSSLPCVACGRPLDDRQPVVYAFIPRSDGHGTWALALHPTCTASLSSTGLPAMVPGDRFHRGHTLWPDCARCREPFYAGHVHQSEFSGDHLRGWTATKTHTCADGGEYEPAEAAPRTGTDG